MASPVKKIALRYLDNINETPSRPLQPSLKHNFTPRRKGEDLDLLAKQLNVTPSKTDLIKNSYESPSATITSFKSSTSSNGSPRKYNLAAPESSPYLRSPTNSTEKSSPGYEYLCRISSIKVWLESVLGHKISQTPVELISYIRNGIHLAELANIILPTHQSVFKNDTRLQFKHTENINRFFDLLEYLDVPDLFRFELTDLYDAKNVPKVWYCLYAMSYMLHKADLQFPTIKNELGLLDFSPEDIRAANRSLVGSPLPNFSSADSVSSGNNSYMNRALGGSQTMKGMNSPTRSPTQSPVRSPTRSPVSRPISKKEPLPKTTPFSTKLTSLVNPFKEAPKLSFDSFTPPPLNDINVTSSQIRELQSYEPEIMKLQALALGAAFRYKMFVDRIMLKSYEEEFLHFVSIIRGNLSRRKTVHRHRDELILYKYDIIELQSLARTKLFKNENNHDLTVHDANMVSFQSIARGAITRNRTSQIMENLLSHESKLSTWQAHAKMMLVHSKAKVVIEHRHEIEPPITILQAACRRVLYERFTKNCVAANLSNESTIVQLQSVIRGAISRRTMAYKIKYVKRFKFPIIELQSIARGGNLRSKLCDGVLMALVDEHDVLSELYAISRGNAVRRKTQNRLVALHSFEDSAITPIQTIFRGVFARFKREILLDDLYSEVHSIIGLQAAIRGFKIRSNHRLMKEYYDRNVEQVVKAQAFIRSTFSRNAYKSLLNMRNPSLAVIRNFVHLLSNSDCDYQQEIELNDLQDLIVEKSKHNEDLESKIENLDVKLGLLDKNKISVEDFVKNKNKYKTFKPAAAANNNSLDKLSKNARTRIEVYQSLFYLLQTNPVYLMRLYRNMQDNAGSSKALDSLQNLVMLLFPIKNTSIKYHSREEFFLVRFITELMKVEVGACRNLSDLTKPQCCLWIDFLHNFNNHTYQRLHLKKLIGKHICRITEDDELNFESDPSQIYEDIVRKEVKVHGFSDRPLVLPAPSAIKEPDVSSQFVENLMSLRECVSEILSTLEAVVESVPLHIRIACKYAFDLVKINFPEKTNLQHLAVAGVIFYKHYVGSIIQNPENFGISVRDPFNPSLTNPRCENNMRHLNRVILQVFAMKPFTDNFLKPLNDYIASSEASVSSLISRIIDVRHMDTEYNLSDYDDIVSHERPKLTMKVSDMIMFEKLLTKNIDVVAPGNDDQLYSVMLRLDDLVNSADEFVELTEIGQVTLNLSPQTQETSVVDSKVTSLFAQVKRCLLYIIRVQEGSGLLELLISGIKPHHEQLFREIISQEQKENLQSKLNDKKRPYYKTSIGDLLCISYHDLKKMALEKILQLESMGHLRRSNSYQDLLNSMAVDIKTKDLQRVARSKQVDIAMKTVDKLTSKEKLLEKQLADYNTHIDKILADLQLRPKERKLFNVIPIFSKQYFYHRELKKANRLPQFGSYKYTAKKLTDQKILVDFGGMISQYSSNMSKLDFMFSCHQTGKFTIEVASGSVTIPGAVSSVSLDELLDLQYYNSETMEMFDGAVVFDTQNLIGFIFRKFYDIKKE
ncbi:hypothetical protein QFC19_005943 [Naganishia cerealis]|uniref:Uncharacterized protein n=1 Tax=Naganishia cerealis TaxID=610337 RepID=A0ACC2VJF2_9TREE|nr:hypothetical protein QFC19_005943 [Naganishia cerealis]